ncbi:MAG: YqeG family HAD IIIA-type phosphatase [Planctomycetia bacterium]|nr:YqeG family HAD IIIA-type phosphatase [Planctomycetia bacterium]
MFKRFLPHLFVDSVLELTPKRLLDSGIQSLLLDVDCTLKSYKEQEVGAEIRCWLENLKEQGIGLCIISNGLERRISPFARNLGIPFIACACKPSPKGCLRAIRENHFEPQKTAMVGDQLFSDIWAGRRAGIFTIRVEPIRPREEPWFARIKRPLEKLVLWLNPRENT